MDGQESKVTKTTVARAAWVVSGGMMISRVLGYVRQKAIAYNYGMGWKMDAYYGAFNIPDLLYFLVSGGALSASFIPVFTGYLQRGEEDEAWKATSIVLNLMILVTTTGVALGLIFAPYLVRVVQPGFHGTSPRTFELCVHLVRILYPMVIFTSIAALCNGILHSFNHFTAPSLSWSIYNVAIIASAFLLSRHFGVDGLCYGVLAGAAGMVMIQAPVILKKGFRYHFSLDLKHPGAREILKLFVPAMFGLAISQINLMLLPNFFGSFLGEGTVASLVYANRLLLLPLGVFGSALAMAVFPTVTRQAGAGDMDGYRNTLVKGIRMTFLFSLPSTVVLFVMGLPVCRLLFQGGKFGYEDSRRTAIVLSFYAIGLIGHSSQQVITRGFYALKDTKTPVRVGIVSVLLITVPLGLVSVYTPLSYRGIPLAVSLTTIANSAVLFVLLRKKIGRLDTTAVLTSLLKIAAAAGLMWAVCAVCRMAFEHVINPTTLSRVALELAVVGGLGTAVFAGVVFGLRVPEASTVLNSFIGRLKRAG